MMRRRGAFTLLELVVAMTIAGLIVVMAAVGLRMSVSSLRRGSAEAERLARLKATSSALSVFASKTGWKYRMRPSWSWVRH